MKVQQWRQIDRDFKRLGCIYRLNLDKDCVRSYSCERLSLVETTSKQRVYMLIIVLVGLFNSYIGNVSRWLDGTSFIKLLLLLVELELSISPTWLEVVNGRDGAGQKRGSKIYWRSRAVAGLVGSLVDMVDDWNEWRIHIC